MSVVLSPLKTKPVIKPIISFDCETYGRKNEFVCGYISTPTDDVYFDNAERMLERLTSREWQHHHIFATNLSFDAYVLFQAVAGSRRTPPGFSQFDNGSKLIWIKKELRDEQRSSDASKKHSTGQRKEYITWADTLNVYPAGVENMGHILQRVSQRYAKLGNHTLAEYFNIKKLTPPGCRCQNDKHDNCSSWLGKKRLNELSPEELIELKEYCRTDAKTTRLWMEWFQGEINDLGAALRLTAASTAMDLFRRKFLRADKQSIPQPQWTCLLESRLSYYGGRVEDYIKGTVGPVWDYDVASMYPSCMRDTTFPYPSPEGFRRIEKPGEHVLDYEGFTRCTIQVPIESSIPPLPWRTKDKLLFPVGELNGVWANLELRYAIEQGCSLIDTSWSWVAAKTFNPFHSYVRELYNKRLAYAFPTDCDSPNCEYHIEGKANRKCAQAFATEEVVKLFLNGLYGKFAQNFLTEKEQEDLGVKGKKQGGTFKRIEEATQEEIEFTGKNFPNYLIDGYVIDKAIPKLKAFMNPILSSYVTAAARIKLHDYMMRATKEGAEVLYTDTDSLYVTQPLSFATQEKVLGSLQTGKQWDKMTILGPKAKLLSTSTNGKTVHYATGKGVPGKSFRYLREDSLETVRTTPRLELFDSLNLDNPTVTFSRFLRFKEAMARGKQPNEIVSVTKVFSPLENAKRKIIGKPRTKDLTQKAYKTRPWIIKEGELI